MNNVETSFLDNLLEQLKSADDEGKKIAKGLANYVKGRCHDAPGDGFSKFMSELNRNLSDLINSGSQQDTLGAITLIDALVDIEYEESAGLVLTRLANTLRNALLKRDKTIRREASVVLGKMAVGRSNMMTDWVHAEMDQAIEWLEQKERNVPRRDAALLFIDCPVSTVNPVRADSKDCGSLVARIVRQG